MQLHIDISKPGEIAQALNLLGALAVAHRATQTQALRQPEAPPPAAVSAMVDEAMAQIRERQAAVEQMQETGGPPDAVHAPDDAPEADEPSDEPSEEATPALEVSGAQVARKGGRKPDSPEVKAQKEAAKAAKRSADRLAEKEAAAASRLGKPAAVREAMAQPVGAALKGVPAHDLAAALNGSGAPHEEAAKPNGTGGAVATVAGDADLAELMQTPKAAAVVAPETSPPVDDPDDAAETGISIDDLLPKAAPAEPAEPAPVISIYHGMNLSQLDVAWRAEGNKRGVHWLRAAIERHGIRSGKDLTKDILVQIMEHPDEYNPPALA